MCLITQVPNWIKVYSRLGFSRFSRLKKSSVLFQGCNCLLLCYFFYCFPPSHCFCLEKNIILVLSKKEDLLDCVNHHLRKQANVVITIHTEQSAESFIPSFVLMSKHNTSHVNCCDPSNPPEGTLTYCLSSVRHCIIYTH